MDEFRLEPERLAAIHRVIDRDPRELADAWPRPVYEPTAPAPGRGSRGRVMLAVETFKRHMTDEGWHLQAGLEHGGYQLWGAHLPHMATDALAIADHAHAGTVFVQDKREWDPASGCCFDKSVGFQRVPALAGLPDLFRVTVLKDLLFHRAYTRRGHEELRPHAVVHYYHRDLVRWLAPWLANTPLIRTWHSIDPGALPHWFPGQGRSMAVVSGALNREVYPFRWRIADAARAGRLSGVAVIPHPGYGASGTCTPRYMTMLSGYKVAICTSSIMGFALRKLIEATACGCIVVTDLPAGEVLPGVDGNLVRVPPDMPMPRLAELVDALAQSWNEARQREWAQAAVATYDYRRVYARLAADIEACRKGYRP